MMHVTISKETPVVQSRLKNLPIHFLSVMVDTFIFSANYCDGNINNVQDN